MLVHINENMISQKTYDYVLLINCDKNLYWKIRLLYWIWIWFYWIKDYFIKKRYQYWQKYLHIKNVGHSEENSNIEEEDEV